MGLDQRPELAGGKTTHSLCVLVELLRLFKEEEKEDTRNCFVLYATAAGTLRSQVPEKSRAPLAAFCAQATVRILVVFVSHHTPSDLPG